MIKDESLTKKGKVRKRKPKKKVDYFTLDTQNAIIKYKDSSSESERNRLYNSEIHHGFYKLVENIIHTFKFYHTEVENIEDLKYEVISFLLQKIHLYDVSKGKAFSYFGTIAKRYLISYCDKNYKKLVDKKVIGHFDADQTNLTELATYPYEKEPNRLDIIEELIDSVESNIFNMFEREEDIKAADAILTILRNSENLDISNKKALYVYAKEISDVKSSAITNAINLIKVEYKKILNRKIENED